MLALVGRANVGKSTLFNRIVGAPLAVVEATPGVTRDRLQATADWAGRTFTLVDTGGLGGHPADPFADAVAAQAEAAIALADGLLLVVDAGEGLHPEDRRLADRLRRSGRPVLLVANKCDRRGAAPEEFYALGLGEPVPVSAAQGAGVGDLLDAALAMVPAGGRTAAAPATEEPGAADAAAPVPVAVVGRPNVGKSSLVNRLVGAERLIVSAVAGTTRDAVDVPWEIGGRPFLLVDTPGLRRRARVRPGELEFWSARRSTRAIARADVVVLVLDAAEPCSEQDRRIAGLAVDRRRALVVVANKADTLAPGAAAGLEGQVRTAMPFLGHAPVVVCSARTGAGLAGLPAAIAAAADAFRTRIPTPALNACLRAAVAERPPASRGPRPVRLYYAAQVGVAPPTVVVLTSRAGAVSPEYARYLEHRLRERFPLTGSPLRLVFRARPHRALRRATRAR